MRISEMLTAIASWLESPDNEAVLLAEYDDACLQVVAESCVEAAAALKKAASTVESMEPAEESVLTPESLEDLAALASALDSSGDEALKKQASVIDALLLTIAAPPGSYENRKNALDKKVDQMRDVYNQPREQLEEVNKIADSKKDIDKSKVTKEYMILEAPLSTRYCPDHAGVQVARVGDHMWQCELDKKIYNFETGFELSNGDRVPGGAVENQSMTHDIPDSSQFDSREERLSR